MELVNNYTDLDVYAITKWFVSDPAKRAAEPWLKGEVITAAKFQDAGGNELKL